MLAGGVQGQEKAPLAHKLSSTADPLRKILRCLDALAAFERDGGELPKLHAAVKEVREVSDPARRAALLNALRVETGDAIQRCGTKGAAEREKRTRDEAAQNGAARLQLHPVLSRLGHKGKFRVLWEYYKAYTHKRPALDALAILHCLPGTYMSDLYEHMVDDIGVAERKSLPELRYLLSLNVCVWWVNGSDAGGIGFFWESGVCFGRRSASLSVREAGRRQSGAWTSGTHFPWWTVRVPGPTHNDPRGARTRTPGTGVVTRTIRVTNWRRMRTQYWKGTAPQRMPCSMPAKVGLLCGARRVRWTTL